MTPTLSEKGITMNYCKWIASLLILLVLLAGCDEEGGTTTADPALTTPTTTLLSVETTLGGHDCTTAVPETDIPVTDASPVSTAAPTTVAPTVPDTDVPATGDQPDTEIPPATEVLGPAVIPTELAQLAKRYPLVSAPGGSYANRTLSAILDAAGATFEVADRRVLLAEGQIKLNPGMVTVLLGASSYDLELAYRGNGVATELYSKMTTNRGKSSEDRQLYQDGWMYHTSVEVEKNQQTTDQYKVAMTPEQFSDYAMSGADGVLTDLSGLGKMMATARYSAVGMNEAGECVILAMDMDGDLILSVFGSDSAIGDAMDRESFQQMQAAAVIGTDGNLRELYIYLPLRLSIRQGGISFSVTGTLELTVTAQLPDTLPLAIPEGGADFPILTIDEAYARRDDLMVW